MDVEVLERAYAGCLLGPLRRGAVRDWEQGRRQPNTAMRTLLKVIARAPDMVAKAAAV